MIIGILSDTHLGYPRFYEDSFKQFDEAFRAACDTSDVVIIPGDIFDTKLPRFEVLARAMHLFESGRTRDWTSKNVKGQKGELPVVVIHGTHDRRSKEMINPVQLLEKSGFVTNASDRTVIFEKRLSDGRTERVAIHGVGGTPEDNIHHAMKELDFKPIEGAYNILVLHQTITDVIPVAEGIALDELPSGFDLYLCGHIHKRVVMKKNGKQLLIPGSTVITQMKKEEEEKKAYVLLDTNSKEIKFVEINSRPFHHIAIEFNRADSTEILDKSRKALDKELAKGEDMPIIKLQLTGSVKEGLKRENIDLSAITQEFGERCYLDVDNSLDVQGMKEKMESLRKMYEQKMSVREIGVQMLKQKIAAMRTNSDGTDNSAADIDVEHLMEILSDEKNIDRMIEEMVKKSPNGSDAIK